MVWLTALPLALSLTGCGEAKRPPPNLEKMRGLAAATPEEPWESKLEKMAEQAVIDAWARHRTPLDFSTNSIQSEEQILDKVGRSAWFKAFSEQDQRAEAMIAGAYVGEVIRRNHGGTWNTNSEAAGGFSFPVKVRGHEVFPITWCLKRLINGREDNVWHKYLFFVAGESNHISYTLTSYSNREDWLRREGIITNNVK